MSGDSTDRLLREYLDAEGEPEDQLCLRRILETVAQPIVRRIVFCALRGPAAQDAEDVVADTIAQMLRRLREWKADSLRQPIRDLGAYVATAAYNNCHERLRQSYPARNRLRNQLLYLLHHHPDFALWRTGDGTSVCGYRRWIGQASPWLERFDDLNLPVAGSAQKRADIVAVVEAVFRQCAVPLQTDCLVEIIARALPLEEQRLEPLEAASNVSSPASVDTQLELRMSLRQIWDDIGRLPQRQRTALLFSLRDVHGREILSLLPLTRTATMKEIADAVQLPLPDLAVLWGELPLDDLTIGKLLGASPQQVI
jgi:DNA-directed RNA polymerase specialized sigma24 family protein